jgi:hypothetical protein
MHRTARRALTLSAAAVACLATSVAPVSAAPAYADPQVAWVNNQVHVAPDGSEAYVLGKYRCYGGEQGTHLWVSVKQGPGLSAPDHLASDDASAWYDTNWNWEQSPAGLTVDCDGHWHVSRVVLKQEFGTLTDGTAYVQWCLFDSTGNEDNFPQGFAYDYGWRNVRVP